MPHLRPPAAELSCRARIGTPADRAAVLLTPGRAEGQTVGQVPGPVRGHWKPDRGPVDCPLSGGSGVASRTPGTFPIDLVLPSHGCSACSGLFSVQGW